MQGILLIQLGSPRSPSPADVKIYLRDFLSDPRLIQPRPAFWKLILELFILPKRSKRSAAAYARIWDEQKGFPLIQITEVFTQGVRGFLVEEDVCVEHAFAIGQEPQIFQALESLKKSGCESLRVIPLFPQFSEATTLSVKDAVEAGLKKIGWQVEMVLVKNFHHKKAWAHNLARIIDEGLQNKAEKSPEKLLLSFHGYPKDRIFAGDPYFMQCIESACLLTENLKEIDAENVLITFQSRFGRKEWLTPSTEDVLIRLAREGVENVVVACPSFTTDNLETLEEVDIGLRALFLNTGGKTFDTIPCLNTDPLWMEAFAHEIALSPEQQKDLAEGKDLEIPELPTLEIPEQGPPPEKLSPAAKASLKVLFLTLFLDLAGFSIIFPLFPALMEFYLGKNPTGLSGMLFEGMNSLGQSMGITSTMALPVLFGGMLTFLYSGLQFLAAPLLGSISDRVGRKPVLLFSLVGILLSHLLWVVSGSFELFLVSRLLGGLASSNISTATAVVADLTTPATRTRGMAVIGIAFGFGFLVGPALGGFSALIDLTKYFPTLETWGLNPFSFPAILAALLAIWNIGQVWKKMPESFPPEKRKKGGFFGNRKILRLESITGVNAVFSANFLFLLFFSGTEFTLTFLARERLGYTPAQNAWLFLFSGLIIILVQGGYVRRKGAEVGERRMALRGLTILAPGLVLVGRSFEAWTLYGGLFLMSVGAAMVIPCLSTLASLYAPSREQGRILGKFRALGSLGRTLGPAVAALLYWKLGAEIPYLWSALLLSLPAALVWKLPRKPSVHE